MPLPRQGSPRARRIIYGFHDESPDTMEAEEVNQIASALAGLRERESQLRRYL